MASKYLRAVLRCEGMWWRRSAAIVAVVLLAGWFGRGAIASAYLSAKLEERGLRCDDVTVDVSALLQTVTLHPLRCALASGPVREVVLEEGAQVTLSGLRPTRVHAPKASVSLEVAEEFEVSMPAMLRRLRAFSYPIRLFGDARLHRFAEAVGELEVDRFVLERDGAPRAVLEGMRISADEPGVEVHAARVSFPHRGPELLVLEQLEGRSDSETLTLEGAMTTPVFGESAFVMEVTDLDGGRPRVDFQRVE